MPRHRFTRALTPHRRTGAGDVSAHQPLPAVVALADLRRRQTHRRRPRRAEHDHLPAAASVLPAEIRAARRLRAARRHHPHHLEGRRAGHGQLPAALRHLRRSAARRAAHGRRRMERLDPRARRRGRVGGDAADPDRGSALAELAVQLAARSAAADRRQPSRAQRTESHRLREWRDSKPTKTRCSASNAPSCGATRAARRRAWPSSPSTAPIGSCSTSSPTTAAFRTSRRWRTAARPRRCRRSSRPSRRWSGPPSPPASRPTATACIDFMDRAHHTPVDAYSRRVPAIWDIADAFGRQRARRRLVDVVAADRAEQHLLRHAGRSRRRTPSIPPTLDRSRRRRSPFRRRPSAIRRCGAS